MRQAKREWTDEQVEQVLGNLLRAGVLVAAFVVAAGGGMYLGQHGAEQVDYRVFHGVEENLRTPWGILTEALALHSRGVIQLGLLLLVATPVARPAQLHGAEVPGVIPVRRLTPKSVSGRAESGSDTSR